MSNLLPKNQDVKNNLLRRIITFCDTHIINVRIFFVTWVSSAVALFSYQLDMLIFFPVALFFQPYVGVIWLFEHLHLGQLFSFIDWKGFIALLDTFKYGTLIFTFVLAALSHGVVFLGVYIVHTRKKFYRTVFFLLMLFVVCMFEGCKEPMASGW